MKRKETDPCRVCGIRPRMVTTTDILTGRVTYSHVPCEHEQRYAAGLCVTIGCRTPRVGTQLRCPAHRAAKRKADRLAASKRYDKTERGKKRKANYQGRPDYRAKAAKLKREKYAALTPDEKAAYLDGIRRRYQMFSGDGYWKRKRWERTTRERAKARRAEQDRAA